MKFSKHLYTLAFKGSDRKREGALLKVQFDDGSIGYADCHPWSELGDLPLKQQLELLASGATTPLSAQSLYFAKLDAEARVQGRSLFEGCSIPKSHSLVTNLEHVTADLGSLIKVKMWGDLKEETESLNALLMKGNTRVRLDFNAKITKKEFEWFLQNIKLDQIDCIEDPFPYNYESWKAIQQNYPVTLACDAGSEKAINRSDAAQVLVLKPAAQSHDPFQEINQRLIVTSYMDHPLGQLCAAYIASTLPSVDICGLLTHRVYQTNEFSEQLSEVDSVLVPPGGTGFGFDSKLEAIDWHAL